MGDHLDDTERKERAMAMIPEKIAILSRFGKQVLGPAIGGDLGDVESGAGNKKPGYKGGADDEARQHENRFGNF